MKKTLLFTMMTMLMAEGAMAQTHYFRAPLLGVNSGGQNGGSEEGGGEEDGGEEEQVCQEETSGETFFVERSSFTDSVAEIDKQAVFDAFIDTSSPEYSAYGPDDFPLYYAVINGEEYYLPSYGLAQVGITNLSGVDDSYGLSVIGDEEYEIFNEVISSFTYCSTGDDGGIGDIGGGDETSDPTFNVSTSGFNFEKTGACRFGMLLDAINADVSYIEATFDKKDYTNSSPYTENHTINPRFGNTVILSLIGTNLSNSYHSSFSADYIIDSASRYDFTFTFFDSSGEELGTQSISDFRVPYDLGESDLFYDENNDYYIEINYDAEYSWDQNKTGYHPDSTAADYGYNGETLPSVATTNLMEERTFVYDGSQTEISTIFPEISESNGHTITMRKYEYSFLKECSLVM